MNAMMLLENRSVIALKGTSVLSFLQGLVTQDMTLLTHQTALYTALLTPQGRYLFDFFVITHEPETFFIECNHSRAADLIKQLSFYKLRSDVQIQDVSASYAVVACMTQPKDASNLALDTVFFEDPRHALLGWRGIVNRTSIEHYDVSLDQTPYQHARLALGIPDHDDLIPQKSLPLESNFDIFNAVSFTKGCYLGQELTTRTKFRGETRKRFLPCIVSEPLDPSASRDVILGNTTIGTLRSYDHPRGLVFVRLTDCSFVDRTLTASVQGKEVVIEAPSWLVI